MSNFTPKKSNLLLRKKSDGKSFPRLTEIAEEILKYRYTDGRLGKNLESKGWDYWGRQMWGTQLIPKRDITSCTVNLDGAVLCMGSMDLPNFCSI